MMSLHTLPSTFARHLGAITEGRLLNAGDVILRWNTAELPSDPNLEATYAAPVAATATIPALIHYVSARAIERNFTEFRAGDAIISFEPSVNLELPGLVFELPDGQIYVQASSGKQVVEFWDVVLGGVPMTRTLLLRLKP
jgi:hypothetical protein